MAVSLITVWFAATHPVVMRNPSYAYLRDFQIQGAYRFDAEIAIVGLWGYWLLWRDRKNVRKALTFIALISKSRRLVKLLGAELHVIRIS